MKSYMHLVSFQLNPFLSYQQKPQIILYDRSTDLSTPVDRICWVRQRHPAPTCAFRV